MDVVEYPIVTEKAMDAMDFDNALVFIVAPSATKADIQSDIEETFEVDVTSVNTMVTPQGRKKATVTLGPEDNAEDVASRIGVF
ncbi:MAG: 50S ribosomal protein L23 [Halobacteriaceae archaeon]